MIDEFNPRKFYDIYLTTFRIRDKLCGGKPKNPSLLETHIKVKTGYDDAQTQAQIAVAKETAPQVSEEELEEETRKSWIGFPEDEHGLFIWASSVKAMFKESASMLDIFRKKMGSKQILQHGYEIKLPEKVQKKLGCKYTDRIYLGKKKADGWEEGVVHARTPKGMVTSIKRVDYVSGVDIQVEIWVLHTQAAEKRHVGEDVVKAMLTFAQENGLGADRSQGQGKLDVMSFECLQKGENPFAKSVDNESEDIDKPKGKKKGKAPEASEEVQADAE